MLRDSTVVVVVVVVVVVRTRPRAIPLAMIHMRKLIHGFPFVPLYGYGAPLGGLRPPSSAMKITVQDYRITQTKYKKAKKGHGWTKLERIEMDCIWENHSQLLCGLDFANERLLLCQFDV